ncbi:MAG: hypothetical protein HEP71_11190 [Roseivirga sp.]|nr:hypothetical protein [Roseivirga sp.]
MKIPDIEKSVAEGRVHERGRYETVFGRYFNKFVYVATVLAVGIMPFLYSNFNYQLNRIRPYWLGISLIVALLIVLRVFNLDKLRRISGRSLEENKNLVWIISQEFDWPIMRDQDDHSILYIARTMTSWERELLIIYDGNDMLVNFTTYAAARSQSLQGYFGEKRAFRRLKKRFSL